jgi:hypothetical protein
MIIGSRGSLGVAGLIMTDLRVGLGTDIGKSIELGI